MSPTPPGKEQSLRDRVTAMEAGSAVAGAGFVKGVPVIALDDGTVVVGGPGAQSRVTAHPDGAILVSTFCGNALVTGGDDGRVMRIDAQGGLETIHAGGGAWIDAVAARDDGAVAWAIGKTVSCRDAKGVVRQAAAPTTARGLAFAPKGYRLAIAYYGGASLWFPNTESAPDTFEWKGSHLDVTISPDGRFLITSMQENALHGWRIADKVNMRMSGYPGKVRSMAWSTDGQWLATAGADACIVWPFKDKDGPMKKRPQELGMRRARVTRVAFNPKALLVALGYEDGWVLLVRLDNGAELLVRRPDADRFAVTGLGWSPDGARLVFGTDGGEAGLLTLP